MPTLGFSVDDFSDDELQALAARLAPLIEPHLRRKPVRWMSTEQAAEYAGCSIPSLHKAMAAGKIKKEQAVPGGKAYFKREWIDDWRRGA